MYVSIPVMTAAQTPYKGEVMMYLVDPWLSNSSGLVKCRMSVTETAYILFGLVSALASASVICNSGVNC